MHLVKVWCMRGQQILLTFWLYILLQVGYHITEFLTHPCDFAGLTNDLRI
jgi:hypothetical protein